MMRAAKLALGVLISAVIVSALLPGGSVAAADRDAAHPHRLAAARAF